MELLKALFENAQLPTDFEAKAATLFEAAVDEKVKAELKSLQEQFDAQRAIDKEAFVTESVALIDAAVEEAIVEWAKDNTVALDAQVKSQIAEQFLGGLKGLFESAEVNLNVDASSQITALQEQVISLSTSLQEKTDSLAAIEAKLLGDKIKAIVESATEGLADTTAERVARLCEAFEFKSEEDFTSKVMLVREAVTGVKLEKPHGDGDAGDGKSALAKAPHKPDFNAPSNGEGDKGDGKSSLAAPHHENQFNAPSNGDGDKGDGKSPLAKKSGDSGGKLEHSVDGSIKGTFNADGTTIVVKEDENKGDTQSTSEEKASLKEQMENLRSQYAPHYGEDLVAATLALLK